MKLHYSRKITPDQLLPVLPVALAPFLLLAPVLVTGKALFWGLPALQFNPWRIYAWQQLSQGVMPLWNPLNGMGAPLAANYQLALFYPPSWLLYLLAWIGGEGWLAWGHGLLLAMHLAWAGLGMAFLLRSLGINRLGQTVGGLAFGLCGFFVARSSVFPMVWTGAWLPWVVLASSRIAVPGRREFAAGRFIPPGLVLALAFMLLAGHAQLSWYTLVISTAWVLMGGWSRSGWKGALASAVRFGLAVLLAVAIASIQLIPTAEYLLQSQRASEVGYNLALAYSFWPWRVLAFFAPNVFGSPGLGNYWGYGAYWEDAVYVGLLPLLLALVSLKTIFKRSMDSRKTLIRFLWTVILISMLLALGQFTPIFPFLYRFVPTFNMFQAPARWAILAEFALALLAGLEADAWRKQPGRSLRLLKLGTLASAAVAFGSLAALFVLKDTRSATFAPAFALAGGLACAAGLLTLRQPPESETRRRTMWVWLVVVFIFADLALVWTGLQPGTSTALYTGQSPAAESLKAQLNGGRLYLSADEEYRIKFSRFFRFNDFGALEDWRDLRETFLPDVNLLDGIPLAANFDPLVPARYYDWMKQVDMLRPEQRLPFLRLMGAGAAESIDYTRADGVKITPVQGGTRWYWATCVVTATGAESSWSEVSRLLSEGGLVERGIAVLEGSGGPEPCPPYVNADIRLEQEIANSVSLRIASKESGWLVLADTWYPGWQAEVDGEPVTILRANNLFRAVAVSAGEHSVVFRYAPRFFTYGSWVSLAGILMFGISFALSKEKIEFIDRDK